MTGTLDSDDYVAGYADGVRDAAAWTAQRAVHLLSLTGSALRAGIRDLHQDAGTRWAQWADRRNRVGSGEGA